MLSDNSSGIRGEVVVPRSAFSLAESHRNLYQGASEVAYANPHNDFRCTGRVKY